MELGVIQGDYPDCPSNAESTKRYYWISRDGTYDANGDENIEGGCVITLNVANNVIKLEDTNMDGTWNFIVGSTAVTSFENDFGKGLVKIGMESTDPDNTVNSKFVNLDYYDNRWNDWESARIIKSVTDITRCSADSFVQGSTTC